MINLVLKEDLDYIKNDIIAKQKNGLFCKYSRLGKFITVTNLSKETHLNYWLSNYKNKYNPEKYPEKYKIIKETLTSAIDDKFENGLTDLDTIIYLEKMSSDSDSVKNKLIQQITEEKAC